MAKRKYLFFWASLGLVFAFCASAMVLPAYAGGDGGAALAASAREKGAITPWDADYIRKRPYLILGNVPNSMTVLWQTFKTPASSTIEWGTTTSYGTGPYAVHEDNYQTNGHQFSYLIRGLKPGTKYHYRVVNDAYQHSGSFTTPPSSSTTDLTFYGYGDTRAEKLALPVEHNDVLTALLTDMEAGAGRQTLLVHMGDYVWNGLNEFLWDWQQFNLDPTYASMSTVFSRLPLMGVLGNHEGYDSQCTTEPNALINYQNIGQIFRKYYPYKYPNPKRYYYSFDYGPVHFVIIDTWTYEGSDQGEDAVADQLIDKQQENWLKNDLRASRKPWKIAMLHTPLWQCVASSKKMQDQLTPILKAGGVQLVLQGHVHYYSRAETTAVPGGKDYSGMTWLVLGGGGAHLNAPTACVPETNKASSPVAAWAFHFARFDITGNSMQVTVRPVSASDPDIDSFTITNGN